MTQYVKRFKEIKNRCFSLTISEVDLADLCFRGLRSSIREKIEGHDYYSVAQVQIRACMTEYRMNKEKENFKSRRSNIHALEYDSDNSTDSDNDVYVAEFVWPSSKKRTLSCPSLKPAQKNRQDEAEFTFDVSKGDRIFDELHKLGHIKISHVIPPVDELKKRAYCKFHNSYSHATNDCNVFRRQIQSAINEGRLKFHDMEVMKNPFPVNTMDLQQPKVLVRPHQAESTKGKNVLIGEEKPALVGKTLVREVTCEKSVDGKTMLKVTLKASQPGGQGSVATPELQSSGLPVQQAIQPAATGGLTDPPSQAVRPPATGGPTARPHGRSKMIVPKRPETGTWKMNVAKNKGAEIKPKVTFDMLFDKYSKQKAVPSGRPLNKRMRSPPRQERPMTPPRDTQRQRSEMWVPPTNPTPVWDDNGVM